MYISLGNHTSASVPEDVASITERMTNSGARGEEVINNLILAPPAPAHPVVNNHPSRAMETEWLQLGLFSDLNFPPVDAPVAPPPPPPPAHKREEYIIARFSELQQSDPEEAMEIRMPQQQQRRVASRAEEERENIRRYVRAAAEDVEEEVRKAYPLLKKLSRKMKNSDPSTSYLGYIYQRIKNLNGKIQKREEDSRMHWGSRLSRIRSEVDMYLKEKRDLYAKFRSLTPEEMSCHDLLPPWRKDDDEAGPSGGSGAAGAAMA